MSTRSRVQINKPGYMCNTEWRLISQFRVFNGCHFQPLIAVRDNARWQSVSCQQQGGGVVCPLQRQKAVAGYLKVSSYCLLALRCRCVLLGRRQAGLSTLNLLVSFLPKIITQQIILARSDRILCSAMYFFRIHRTNVPLNWSLSLVHKSKRWN